MADTRIEWTDRAWNPTSGCDRVSAGCDHCYALRMAKRLKAMGAAKYQQDGDPVTSGPGFLASEHADALTAPLRWKKPTRIFVNSMSDLFHDNISDEFIARVFAVMAATPQHTYQILTKRHARMRSFLRDACRCGSGHVPGVHLKSAMSWAATPHSPTYVPGIEPGLYHRITWPLPNVWLGVSVEDQQWADIRIPALLDTPAAVRWVSAEPLLGPVDLRLWDLVVQCMCEPGDDYPITHRHEDLARGWHYGIDWVVTGGESGPGARPADPDWFRAVRDQCAAAGVAYLHKQNGGITPKANGRLLDGRIHDDYPEVRIHA